MQRSDAQGPLYPDSSVELQCKDTLKVPHFFMDGRGRNEFIVQCLAGGAQAIPRALSIVLREELTRAKIT